MACTRGRQPVAKIQQKQKYKEIPLFFPSSVQSRNILQKIDIIFFVMYLVFVFLYYIDNFYSKYTYTESLIPVTFAAVVLEGSLLITSNSIPCYYSYSYSYSSFGTLTCLLSPNLFQTKYFPETNSTEVVIVAVALGWTEMEDLRISVPLKVQPTIRNFSSA